MSQPLSTSQRWCTAAGSTDKEWFMCGWQVKLCNPTRTMSKLYYSCPVWLLIAIIAVCLQFNKRRLFLLLLLLQSGPTTSSVSKHVLCLSILNILHRSISNAGAISVSSVVAWRLLTRERTAVSATATWVHDHACDRWSLLLSGRLCLLFPTAPCGGPGAAIGSRFKRDLMSGATDLRRLQPVPGLRNNNNPAATPGSNYWRMRGRMFTCWSKIWQDAIRRVRDIRQRRCYFLNLRQLIYQLTHVRLRN